MAPVLSKFPLPDDTPAVRYLYTQALARAELDRLNARRKELEAARKERLRNDPEYIDRQQQKKRKHLEHDRVDVNAKKHAEMRSKTRKVAKEMQDTLSAQEREDMIEKVELRYSFPSSLI
jgi:hypothetical protein